MKGYSSQNNAYIKTVKDDWRDRLEVEIGDEKDPSKFQPQVKIKRWDNEVNASFRLLDNEPKQLKTEGEKIRLIGVKKEVHFYEDGDNYEFEVILKTKPTSNKLEFSIETKGLDFFYQPELTQKEIDDGCIRPENVIGSYAVYHNGNPINYVGGKLYKTGQFGFIYRPRIEDANGDWVWGKLNVDVKKKLLTVTIPQNFLDKAVYPIRHAAGFLFGYNTEGGSSYECTNRVLGSTYTITEDGTGVSMTAYVSSAIGGDKKFKMAIYEGVVSVITNGSTDETTIAGVEAGDWHSANFSTSPSLIKDTAYGLVGWADDTLKIYYNSFGDKFPVFESSETYGPTWPDNPSTWNGTRKFSIYCTYEEAAEEGPAGGGEMSTNTKFWGPTI